MTCAATASHLQPPPSRWGACTALVQDQPIPGHGLKQSACSELLELSSNKPFHINKYDTGDDKPAPGHLNQVSHLAKDTSAVMAAARSSTPSSTHWAEKQLSQDCLLLCSSPDQEQTPTHRCRDHPQHRRTKREIQQAVLQPCHAAVMAGDYNRDGPPVPLPTCSETGILRGMTFSSDKCIASLPFAPTLSGKLLTPKKRSSAKPQALTIALGQQ